ncbi:MAG: hypothetical protein WDZ94_01090 [Patescibacteria group bacterium]
MKWSNSLESQGKDVLILVLQRTQLVLYLESKNSLQAWNFETTQVHDLEIIDEALYRTSLEKILKQLDIGAKHSVLLILDSSISFIQQIETASSQDKQPANPAANPDDDGKNGENVQQIRNQDTIDEEARVAFTRKVPFTNTFSTVLQIGKERYVLAVNRDLYEPIVSIVEGLGAKMSHILPMRVLSGSFSEGITEQAFQQFLKNIEKYKQYNLLHTTINREVEPMMTANMKSKEHPQRVYMLIGTFTLLILIFGLVWYWSQQREQAELEERLAEQAQLEQAQLSLDSTPADEAEEVEEVVEAPAAIEPVMITELAELEVEIQYAQESQERAAELSQVLEANEVSVVLVLGAQLEPAATEALVLMAPTVSEEVQVEIADLLAEFGVEGTFETSEELGVDMRLVI